MLITIGFHPVDCAQVFTDGNFQSTCSRAMQDANTLCAELDSVINEIGDRLQGLVGTHATHVNVGFEIQLTSANLVGRCSTQRLDLVFLFLSHAWKYHPCIQPEYPAESCQPG